VCLAIPMQICEIDGYNARCEAKGVYRDVSLFMLQNPGPAVGDFVLVHVGYAIQKVSERDARRTWALLDKAVDALDEPADPATADLPS